MVNNKNTNEISDLSDLLKILGKSNLDQGSSPRYYFRGQSIFERPLIPKLIRNSTLLGEHGMPGLIRDNPTIGEIQTRLLQRLKSAVDWGNDRNPNITSPYTCWGSSTHPNLRHLPTQ